MTETDDLHPASVTHPGCVVVPVALLLGAVGLYGILYLEVARRPERGWLLAAVGLAGVLWVAAAPERDLALAREGLSLRSRRMIERRSVSPGSKLPRIRIACSGLLGWRPPMSRMTSYRRLPSEMGSRV